MYTAWFLILRRAQVGKTTGGFKLIGSSSNRFYWPTLPQPNVLLIFTSLQSPDTPLLYWRVLLELAHSFYDSVPSRVTLRTLQPDLYARPKHRKCFTTRVVTVNHSNHAFLPAKLPFHNFWPTGVFSFPCIFCKGQAFTFFLFSSATNCDHTRALNLNSLLIARN